MFFDLFGEERRLEQIMLLLGDGDRQIKWRFCFSLLVECCINSYKTMDGNKKFTPIISPFKSLLGGVRSMEQLPTDPGKSMLNTANVKNFEKYEVIIQNQKLENELKLIDWRSKTELPIVKILFYKILQKKLLNQCSVLQVAIENYPCNLNSLPRMPLYQLLYLLKQSLFGFEKLFDHFGAFDITNRMILINKNSRCRVWINENITLNHPSRKTKLSECEFLGKIVRIFQQKCLKSTLSSKFFEDIITFDLIADALSYLDDFIKAHKIVMPNRLNSITESLGSKKFLEKHEHHLEKIQECIHFHETVRKVPKFLAQIREEKRPQSPQNKSYDSPQKDRSFHKIRDHSQHKPRLSKQEEDSNSKSNLTPKSRLSVENNKETKSNIDIKETNPMITRTLQKRKSEQCLNLRLQEFKPYRTGTDKIIQIKQEHVNEELYFTKIPAKQTQPKSRKFSTNNIVQCPLVQNHFSKALVRDRNERKIQVSQLTATTIDEYHKKGTGSTPQTPQTPHSPLTPHQTPFTIMEEKEMSIFEKHKWIKRMNSLNGQNARETINSLHDGVDTFSQEFTLAGQTLNLLGSMGKQLKGSFMGDG